MQKNKSNINVKLLHPEERVTRLPLDKWAEKITVILEKFISPQYLMTNMEDFAACLNQAALVFSYFGAADITRRLCFATIDFYSVILSKYNSKEFMLYQVQAWINLGRLHRILKQHQQAADRFAFLLDTENITHYFFSKEDPSSRLAISEALVVLKSDSARVSLVWDVPFIEIAKTHLDALDSKSLLQIFPFSRSSSSDFISSVISEAQLISLMLLGDYDSVKEIIDTLYNSVALPYRHVFLFRKIEFLNISGDQRAAKSLVETLLSVNKAELSSGDYQDKLFFNYESALLLLRMNEHIDAYNLLDLCYKGFVAIDDEVGQFLCLQHLAVNALNKKSEYNESLAALLDTTGYAFIRKAKSEYQSKEWHKINILQELYCLIRTKLNYFGGKEFLETWQSIRSSPIFE